MEQIPATLDVGQLGGGEGGTEQRVLICEWELISLGLPCEKSIRSTESIRHAELSHVCASAAAEVKEQGALHKPEAPCVALWGRPTHTFQ